MGLLAVQDPNPEEAYGTLEFWHFVRRIVDSLSLREAAVIRAYYFEGETLADFARTVKYSKARFSRIHGDAKARLHTRIGVLDLRGRFSWGISQSPNTTRELAEGATVWAKGRCVATAKPGKHSAHP